MEKGDDDKKFNKEMYELNLMSVDISNWIKTYIVNNCTSSIKLIAFYELLRVTSENNISLYKEKALLQDNAELGDYISFVQNLVRNNLSNISIDLNDERRK